MTRYYSRNITVKKKMVNMLKPNNDDTLKIMSYLK